MEINTSRVEHQILPMARFAVRCACGYAHDSRAETAEEAIKEVRSVHDPKCDDYTATPYDCIEHQSIGTCAPCLAHAQGRRY